MNLPIIDLERFVHGSPDERLCIAEDIGHTCETMGFIYVKNHGVDEAVIADARASAEAFFAQARDVKMMYERPRGHYRGYIPVSDFTKTADGRPPVHYEAYLVGHEIDQADPAIGNSHGMLIPNIWPENPIGFRSSVTAYWQGVEQVGRHLLEAFDLALGGPETDSAKPSERLNDFFTKPLSNISLLHYLPREETGDRQPDNARAHYDTNALTILLPGEVGGLEAMKPDGAWMEIEPLKNCFVVNIGNMMACWSGGRFKSTMHRVHPPLGVDRYSIAYFTVPDYDTVVRPLSPETVIDQEISQPVHVGEDLARFVASCDAMQPVYG